MVGFFNLCLDIFLTDRSLTDKIKDDDILYIVIFEEKSVIGVKTGVFRGYGNFRVIPGSSTCVAGCRHTCVRSSCNVRAYLTDEFTQLEWVWGL